MSDIAQALVVGLLVGHIGTVAGYVLLLSLKEWMSGR